MGRDPEQFTPQQQILFRFIDGNIPRNHLFSWGMHNQLERLYLHALRYPRAMVEIFSDEKDLYEQNEETAELKMLFEQFSRNWPYTILFSDYQRLRYRIERTVAQIRMCNLAVKLEQERRKGGMLPALPSDAPIDPVGGEPFQLTSGEIEIWTDKTPHRFDGWQLHSPGTSRLLPSKQRDKSDEDFFPVITTRPEALRK